MRPKGGVLMVRFCMGKTYDSTNVQERRHCNKTDEDFISHRTRQELTRGLECSHPIPLGRRFWKPGQRKEEVPESFFVWEAEGQGRRNEGDKGGAGLEESADECKVVEILSDAGALTRIMQLT